MKQCVMRKANRVQVAWIPVRFAQQGKFVRLHDEDGWEILQVGNYLEKVNIPHGYFGGGIYHR